MLGIKMGAASVDGADVREIAVLCEGETDLYEEPIHLGVKLYSEKGH
jgi:hypothetical protein